MDSDLKLKDFIDATAAAARRSRGLMISIFVAIVLLSSGFLNSMDSGWMHHRAKMFATDSDYRTERIGLPPGPEATEAAKVEYQARYTAFYAAICKGLIENSAVKLPFFGITIDGPDIGIVGGAGLCLLLGMLLASLQREEQCLRITHVHAMESASAAAYELVAMQQWLAVPQTDYSRRMQTNRSIQRFLIALPPLLLTGIVLLDLATFRIGLMMNVAKTVVWFLAEAALLALSIRLSELCMRQLKAIHDTFDMWWGAIGRDGVR